MAAPNPFTVLNVSAVSQHDRIRGAPAPEKVKVDSRSRAQLLAFSARYGALINFFDLDNKADGDWAAFFAADPAVAHALHASLDLPAIEQLLANLLASFKAEGGARGRARDLKQVLDTLNDLVKVLDRAHMVQGREADFLGGLDPDRRSDSLAGPLRRLRRRLAGGGLRRELDDAPGGGGGDGSADLGDILEDAITALLDELKQGMSDAEAALHASMETGGHAPQAALYNAFVLLFLRARETLNQFPRRLVDYYYEDVLAQQDLAAQPDQLFLTFTLNTPEAPGSVPRGALFSAGVDASGEAIHYVAANSLAVAPVTVENLSVHRVTYTQANGGKLPSGVLRGNVPVGQADPDSSDPFPLFGAPTPGEHGAMNLQPADLGFTISTPVLLAQGGVRTVEIGLVVSHQLAAQAIDALRAHGLANSQDQIAATLAEMIHQSFRLYYSTAGGWIAVKDYSVTATQTPGPRPATRYALTFVLPDDAPPIEPLSAKPAPNAPAPSEPASKFPGLAGEPTVVGTATTGSAKPGGSGGPAPIDPFPILSAMIIDQVTVDLTVEGLSALTVTSANGPVDTSQSFALLGMPPVQFGGFEVYAPELFAKALNTLSVSITWTGLPVSNTGFRGYYKGYLRDADGNPSSRPLFDNTVFKVAFSVKNPGLWNVGADAEPLFRTALLAEPPPSGLHPPAPPAPDAPVLRQSRLEAKITETSPDPPPYYNPAASALRVSLTDPPYAFGNALFTINMMAAAAAQTAAAQAAAKKDAGDDKHGGAGKVGAGGGAAQVASLASVNATTPDEGYAKAIAPQVERSVSALTGDALAAVKLAISLSGAPVASQAALLSDLDAALTLAPQAVSIWRRITGASADPAAVLNGLEAWLRQHEAELGAAAQAAVTSAFASLDAGKAIATTHASVSGQPPAVARPSMAAAAQAAQAAVADAATAHAATTNGAVPYGFGSQGPGSQPPTPPTPAMPNPPWLPTASALSVNYTATTRATELTRRALPLARSSAPASSVQLHPAPLPPTPPAFAQIGPFGRMKPARPSVVGVMGLVPLVDTHAAFYIQLSAQTSQVSLLFILTAGPNGWWDAQPKLHWEQYVGGRWRRATLLGDTTHNLANSGVVTLGLQTGEGVNEKPRLRIRALGDTTGAPLVKAVIANAVTASWVGPGGSGSLGQPLPAETITKSVTPLTNIGAIAQPMESFGGRPPLDGGEFQMWMAERLRHKSFGVAGWDYARLVLEGAPSIWQAVVVPAVDGESREASAGSVWVVVVAGPKTPNVADPTVPTVDFTALSTIGESLKACISPFIDLTVTNPPYLRLKVTATCVFSPDDTPAFWIAKLQDELVRWLSPWPPNDLGERPATYYTRRAVAQFMRGRPYVVGVTSLKIEPETPPASGAGFHYLTSSKTHNLTAPPPAAVELQEPGLAVEAAT